MVIQFFLRILLQLGNFNQLRHAKIRRIRRFIAAAVVAIGRIKIIARTTAAATATASS